MNTPLTETEILDKLLSYEFKIEWAKELQDPLEKADYKLWKAAERIQRTELTTAKAIAEKLGDHLSYVAESKTWYLWDGKIHRPCHADGVAVKVVKAYYEVLTDALRVVSSQIEVLHKTMGEETAKPLRTEFAKHKSFRDLLASDRGQKAVVNQLRTNLDVPFERYGDDRRWFVVENGVFDMEDVRATKQFTLLPHDAKRPVYRMWNLRDEPGATSPSINKFLSGSIEDEGQGRFFSKAVALACMGAPVTTRTIVSLQGARKSGKSMINRVINRLTGENGIYAEPARDAIVANGRNPHHARYPMREARYVAFTEITDRLDREFILKYTGGDKFPVEQKYVAGTQVKPQGIIFLASNHGMDIDKTDEAIFERMAPINFPRTFEKVSMDGTHIVDPDLEDKIVAEAPGFLNWLKWAYLTYLEEGLDKTEAMEALKRAERDDEESITQFIIDRTASGYLQISTDAKLADCITVAELFANYLEWAKEFNLPKEAILKRSAFVKEVALTYPKLPYQTMRFSGLVSTQRF